VTAARAWHLVTAVVALVALLLQLVLVVNGDAILVDHDPPSLGERLVRFFAYFTIESNILVLVTTAWLARDPAYDGPRWRVVRIAAVSGITVTGLVHWFLLRPLLHLDGADLVADKLLHLVVPILAVVGWLVFRPATPRRLAGLPPGRDVAAGLARRDAGGGRPERLVPLPVPRPPRAQLGPRHGRLRGDLRAVLRDLRGDAGVRPADAPVPRHW
jgi:hypothetical protein